MKNYLIGLLFILVSCNGQKKASVENSSRQSTPESSLILILQDEYGGFDVEETMVIKDQKRLKSFYSKINRTRKPGLPVPVIDFSKEMLVIQCSGEQQHAGLPTLSFVEATTDQIVLDAKMEREAADAKPSVTKNPFCIYKMPFSDKEIVVRTLPQ